MNSFRILTLLVPCLLIALAPNSSTSRGFGMIGNKELIMVGLFAAGFQLSNRFVVAKMVILLTFVFCAASSTVSSEFYLRQRNFRRGWYEGASVPTEFLINTALYRVELLILEMLLYFVLARLFVFLSFTFFKSQILKRWNKERMRKRWYIPQFSIAGSLWLMILVALNIAIQRNASDSNRDMAFEWRGLTGTLLVLLVSWTIVLVACRLRRINRHIFLIGLWLVLPFSVMVCCPILIDGPRRFTRPSENVLLVASSSSIEVLVQSAILIQVLLFWIETWKLAELLIDSAPEEVSAMERRPVVSVHPLKC